MSHARPSRRKNCGVRPQFYATRARPRAAGERPSNVPACRLPQALRVAPEHGAGAAPSGPAFQEPVEGFRLVPGDERGLRGPEQERVLHDPADDGLAAHGQEAFGRVAGVGAHALALARDWQDDLHFSLIPWFCGNAPRNTGIVAKCRENGAGLGVFPPSALGLQPLSDLLP